MKQMSMHVKFENLLSFTPAELKQFFDRQSSQFNLSLICNNVPWDSVDLIRQEIGTHFEDVTYSFGTGDGFLVILLNDNRRRMKFQVGSGRTKSVP
uniref:Transposase n=1 Tax=Panagrellus redivivus TaxID=6233 RepID=A0A7E4ZQX0_PANRE